MKNITVTGDIILTAEKSKHLNIGDFLRRDDGTREWIIRDGRNVEDWYAVHTLSEIQNGILLRTYSLGYNYKHKQHCLFFEREISSHSSRLISAMKDNYEQKIDAFKQLGAGI